MRLLLDRRRQCPHNRRGKGQAAPRRRHRARGLGLTTRPPVRLILAEIAGGAVYLGLAIVGRGGFSAFFSEPALCAVAAFFVAMAVAGFFTQGNISPGVREDRSNRWVIAVFTAIGFIDAYLPAYTDRIGFWTIDGNTIRWVGVALFVIGGALRLWPVFVLGRRFSGLVAIQPGHTLTTTGIYSVIRHPSYLGLLINALGWGLAFRSIVGVVLAALYLLPLLARIRSEEALLSAHFGAEYAAYRRQTWRLLPGIY
ncbi:MAG: isoprenylcysteine carboxylmethyltransferase family protein [Alphaproteobacteria bacterium]|nr:isoprenylcysteine carboxylmethyltransferase family protein [Alphaproteobacteria bacterium]